MNLAYYTKYYSKILGSLEQNLYGISIVLFSVHPIIYKFLFLFLVYYKLLALCKVSYKIET